MGLSVYLTISGEPRQIEGGRIFVRQNGATREISREEWDARFPGLEPVVMDATESNNVYDTNITHNLGNMARAAEIYTHLWRPEEIGITKARELIEPLSVGLAALKADPEKFKVHNAPNGWGLYEHFVPFVADYLAACRAYPEADVSVSR